MDKKQQEALNAVLKAVAAFLLTLVEEAKPAGDTAGEDAELVAMLDEEDAKAKEQAKKDIEAEDKKKKKADKKAEEKKEEPKPPEPPKEIAPTNPDALLADARAAAVQFAGKHGREALRTLLNEFTKGNIAEVAKDKLPELIKKLRA